MSGSHCIHKHTSCKLPTGELERPELPCIERLTAYCFPSLSFCVRQLQLQCTLGADTSCDVLPHCAANDNLQSSAGNVQDPTRGCPSLAPSQGQMLTQSR